MARRLSPTPLVIGLLLAVAAWQPPVMAAAPLPDGQAFEALVASDLAAGTLTAEEALLLRFQYGFSASELPPRYQVAGFSPLPCATGLIAAYYRERPRLTNDTVTRIDGWLQPATDKLLY